jgi:uncharacterized membrane protein YgdD (TMEM256/DUF423 family)
VLAPVCALLCTFHVDNAKEPGANPSQDAMNFHARWFVVLGGLNAAIAVALGAAGTHALKAQLALNDPSGWFAVALQYHQYHSLGLIVVGLLAERFPPSKWFTWAGWFMLGGILVFSGNLYLRSLAGIHALHAAIPVGGAALIASWLLLAIGGVRSLLPRNP